MNTGKSSGDWEGKEGRGRVGVGFGLKIGTGLWKMGNEELFIT